MTKITISIFNHKGDIKKVKKKSGEEILYHQMQATGTDEVSLATRNLKYEDGDKIVVNLDQKNVFLIAKLDETLDTSLIYVKDQLWEYSISKDSEQVKAGPMHRFSTGDHVLSIRTATSEEISSYRNLALNPHDQKEFNGAYPHAFANVETRNDATFFACNAIDGVFANHSHGSYPFQSWGINQQKDAALTIDFGRKVCLDQVVFTFRADFPHDNFWEQVSLIFSDGSKETFHTKKTDQRQMFSFSKRQVTSVTFTELKQSEEESPFPALTEIELFGINQE
ncbi:hypothetical protein [Enterococcus sp. JM9B]|uniref:hypothetical protein n=1 Tax=Enterococcus sp. JM9B TaxID=1857216 RepID=UPI001374DDD3|nr:hypothetical protein [Enterococcus sp. JM9B]KAF1302804.1 hypothetical protein BAU16_05920 [Enterococcus sp. JM9B]